MSHENKLLTETHLCVCLHDHFEDLNLKSAGDCRPAQLSHVTKHFCGRVITDLSQLDTSIENRSEIWLYLTGDIRALLQTLETSAKAKGWNRILIIKDLSYNFMDNKEQEQEEEEAKKAEPALHKKTRSFSHGTHHIQLLGDTKARINGVQLISSGQVPLYIHGIGLFVRDFFGSEIDYFGAISGEHEFERLTESNKPSEALRKGRYFSNVVTEDSALTSKSPDLSTPTPTPIRTPAATTTTILTINPVASSTIADNATLDTATTPISDTHAISSSTSDSVTMPAVTRAVAASDAATVFSSCFGETKAKATIKKDGDSKALIFNLLRCSTNFPVGTDNFRRTDHVILSMVQEYANAFFADKTVKLNHVLAQIYWNHKNPANASEKKASIKPHSDKTKDMPRNGLMAFCTFYKDFCHGKFHDPRLVTHVKKKSALDPLDFYYKGNVANSVLTKLRFKLKPDTQDTLSAKNVDVVMYPGSLLLTSLEQNRRYTHETVQPGGLSISNVPTRMGYVIRCSKTLGRWTQDEGVSIKLMDDDKNNNNHSIGTSLLLRDKNKDCPLSCDHIDDQDKCRRCHLPPPTGTTKLSDGGGLFNVWKKLEPPTEETTKTIKDIYFLENATSQLITYPPLTCSLNAGDYMSPVL